MSIKRAKWEIVGWISVDAGIIKIGDPCYETDEEVETALYLNSESETAEIPHDSGLMDTTVARGYGKAVILRSGLGDGVYAVEVKRDLEHGFIKEMRIKFF